MKHDVFKAALFLFTIVAGYSVYASAVFAVEDTRTSQGSRTTDGRYVETIDRSATKIKKAADDRRGRFVNNAIDDLNYSVSLSNEDIKRLSRLIDHMTPLEPLKREYDVRTLLDWYYRYADWIKYLASESEEMQINLPAAADLSAFYAGLQDGNRNSADELDEMVLGYQAELKELFRILERRQFLNERLYALNARLSEIERKLKHQHVKDDQRSQFEMEASGVRENINVVQTELVSLVDINEDLLKHYVVMIEMGQEQLFWMGLKEGEYQLLADVSRFVDSADPGDASRLSAAYRGLVRGYESDKKRLDRRIDELDRKGSDVTPVGSFRDLDRSRELSDFYRDRRQRYADYLNRLEIRIGAAESELILLAPGN